MTNFYKSVKNIDKFGKKLNFNEAYINQCNVMLERTSLNYDNIFLVTGMEGTGKSYGIAIPTAYYLSGPNMKVVFTWEQFEKYYKTMPPKSTIVWDEFILAGMSTDALSEMQKNIIQLMVTGRKKLINVILVVPSIFLLKNYFAVHRALFQVHTDSPDFLSRGYAYFYSFEDKRRLFNKYRKSQYTNTKLASFGFKFVEQKEPLYDMVEYERLKDEAIASIGQKDSADNSKNKWRTMWIDEHRDEILESTSEGLSTAYGLTARNWRLIQQELRKKEEVTQSTANIIQYCEKEAVPTKLSFNIDKENTGDKLYC
jgi:hypothetical protein